MRLVIDLPQEEYEDILNDIEHARIAGVPIGILYQAIENGTSLPKGHGRLIDADELCDSFEPSDFDDEPWDNVDNACRIIHSMPVIDAVPMSVIDDIKAEIDSRKFKGYPNENGGYDLPDHQAHFNSGLMFALDIIDKHIGERGE